MGCLFCEIVSGRLEEEILHSDETVVAFLCEPPATIGHVLVVPREHRRDIWAITPDEAAQTMALAHRLAQVARENLGPVGVNLRQNSGSRTGQDVFHYHLHVIPRYEDDTC